MAAKTELEVVKRPHSKTDFTEQHLLELVQCVEDPLYFIRTFVKIQHPLRGAVPFEPYPFQVDLINAFHEHRFTVALTARQLGKALALDTPIPTPTGWTTMGAIKVGDQVLGDDGLPVTVSFVTDPMYDHKCYEVEFDNGEIITADAEHLWRFGSTVFRDDDTKFLTTEEVIPWWQKAKKRGQGIFVATADPLQMPEVNLPVKPYTLGVWLGDGNAADGRFCGHKNDCEEMRSHVMADGYTLSEIKADPRNNVRFQTVYGLRGGLVDIGVFRNKHIPQAYLRASVEQRLELLRGLMDTDGHADPSGGFEFYQKSKVLAEQVCEIVSSLGMKPRLKPKVVNGEMYWRVRFATNRTSVFKLARKQNIAAQTQGHPKNHRFYIKDIREVPSVPVKCIRVENESHMFLCGKSMIPTHNTTCAATYLLWKAMFNPDVTILITANKYVQALEIMDRVRYTYENLPDHIRAGVVEYNKGTIAFDNGSKIISRATSADAGRGLSITLLYCLGGDTIITVRDKTIGEVTDINLRELYGKGEDSFRENTRFEILTPDGWRDFRGVAKKPPQRLHRVLLEDGHHVDATTDHQFFTRLKKRVAVGDMVPGETELATEQGYARVISVDLIKEDVVYDIIEVDHEDHAFVVNRCFHTKNCDELAFIQPNKQKEFWTSIQPILSTGGSCIVTSTPKSDEDIFAQIWKGAIDNTDEFGNPNETGVGKNGFYPIKVPWWMHPERDEEWAKPFRETLGEARFRQEMEGEFVTDDETLINPLTLTRLKSALPDFYTGTVRWYDAPKANHAYLVGLDPSLGTGRDYGAIQVFELPSMKQVGEWQHNHTAPRGQVRVLLQVLTFLDATLRDDPEQMGDPEIFWTVENNSIGEAVLQVIEDTGEENFPGMMVSERRRKGQVRRFRKGMHTDNRKKLSACARFKSLVESDRMQINSAQLIRELKHFVAKETSFSAKPGEHDDLVSACLLITRMLDVVLHWGTDATDLKEVISEAELYEDEPLPVVL